jgi:hypothetical protein
MEWHQLTNRSIRGCSLFGHPPDAHRSVDGDCHFAASLIANQSRTNLIYHVGKIHSWWLAMQLWLYWWEVISLLLLCQITRSPSLGCNRRKPLILSFCKNNNL